MTIYLTEDAYGHCKSQEQIDEIRAAIKVLNDSEVIAAQEENANHHREADFRQEMAGCLHIADISEWKGTDDYKEATCKACGCTIYKNA